MNELVCTTPEIPYRIPPMPNQTPSTFSDADVRSHNSAKTCYVTLGPKVYDVTSFLDDHPGGADLILDYGGTDVKNIMEDALSHRHSEAAYEMLEDFLVGSVISASPTKYAAGTGIKSRVIDESPSVYITTGMSREDDLSVETDFVADYRTHRFLDLSSPLFPQLWYGSFTKEFYLQQVHRPRHYKGGDSAPLFGNFLEPLTKAAWYVIPIVWLPPVIYGTIYASAGLNSPIAAVAYWLFGLCFWTLIEYGLHRFLFHVDRLVK